MNNEMSPYKMRRALLLAFLAAAAPALAQDHHYHRFNDAQKWAKVFDDPARDEWQKPAEVVAALKLAPDAVVADIGAGTGYFAVRLARAVPQGHVYAVDTEPDMVRYLGERVKRESIANLTPIRAGDHEARLPAPADLVILVDVYHHVPQREQYFAALRSSLKAGGRLVIIDFTLDSPVGPPRKARIPPGRVKQELAKAGYTLAAEHGFLPNQYFLVFRPAS